MIYMDKAATSYHKPLEYTHNRIIQIAARNLELFLAGKALEHEVDRQSGYGK